MFKPLLGTLILASTIALSACNTTPFSSDTPQTHLTQLQNQRWVVTQIGSLQIAATPKNQHVPYIQLDAINRQISGSDGCNRIMGTYQTTGSQLSFSELASTKMICLDANMLLASQFTEALSKVAHYQVYNHSLKLLDRHGNVLMQLSSRIATP